VAGFFINMTERRSSPIRNILHGLTLAGLLAGGTTLLGGCTPVEGASSGSGTGRRFPTEESSGGEVKPAIDVKSVPIGTSAASGSENSSEAEQRRAFFNEAKLIGYTSRAGDGVEFTRNLGLASGSALEGLAGVAINAGFSAENTIIMGSTGNELFALSFAGEGMKVASEKGGAGWITDRGVARGTASVTTNAEGKPVDKFVDNKGQVWLRTDRVDATGLVFEWIGVNESGNIVSSRNAIEIFFPNAAGENGDNNSGAALIDTKPLLIPSDKKIAEGLTCVFEPAGYYRFLDSQGNTIVTWNPYAVDEISGLVGAWGPGNPGAILQDVVKPTEVVSLPPTREPTKEPAQKPEVQPTPLPKEVTTEGKVAIYDSQSGDPTGYILPDKTIPVEEWVTDANGVLWARLPGGKWAKAYGQGGLFPPAPELPVAGGETIPGIPREIDLGQYGFVLHNMGRHGFYVQGGGFVDSNGNYCPAAAGQPCEGMVGVGSGMADENLGYIRDMLIQFNSGTGMRLEEYFYDPSNPSPYLDQSQKFNQWYRYAVRKGNVLEVHFGISTENYNEATRQQVLFGPMVDLEYFLIGDYEGVVSYRFNGSIPQPLQALDAPSKVYWK
jgi:hypothetical protein